MKKDLPDYQRTILEALESDKTIEILRRNMNMKNRLPVKIFRMCKECEKEFFSKEF